VGRGGLSVYSSSRRGLLEAGYMIFRVAEAELMPSLVVGNTERCCGKLKRGNRFLEPNIGVLPKLYSRGVRYDEYDGLMSYFHVVVGRAFIGAHKKFHGQI
jgi:hypothetical protein